MAEFYVYEHVRADTGAVFYVGKGSGWRSKSKQGRNRRWHGVVRKAGGYEIRHVLEGVDEEFAYLAEAELIYKHRRRGTRLCNVSDGGEGGLAGYTRPAEVVRRIADAQRGQKRPTVAEALRGIPKSPEHRARLSAAKMGQRPGPETRAKMSKSRKGKPSSMLGKRHTADAKAAISAAVSGERNPFYGKQHPREVVERIRAANIGRRHTPETRQRMSQARSGAQNPRFGKPTPAEQKERQRATLMARPKLTCPHCGVAATEGNARRWHFDNCRSAA